MGLGYCPEKCANCCRNYQRTAEIRKKFDELPDREKITTQVQKLKQQKNEFKKEATRLETALTQRGRQLEEIEKDYENRIENLKKENELAQLKKECADADVIHFREKVQLLEWELQDVKAQKQASLENRLEQIEGKLNLQVSKV